MNRRHLAGRAMLAAGSCFLLGMDLRSAAAGAPEAGRPNVLLIIADDWSWGHAGAYGCRWIRTPAFDRVAREGLLFRDAFTNNPKCSPCRASLLAGRNSWQLEEAMCHNGRFRANWPVYPDLLERAGYLVGHTGKGWGPGDFRSGGFPRNPAGPGYQTDRIVPPLEGVGRTDYAGNFAAFLKSRRPGQPFGFWVGGTEPHRPYEVGSGRRAGRRLADVQVPAYLPENRIVRSDLLDYALEVEWLDAQVGRILGQLEAAGELDRTLIVYTSDHGMPFPRAKGQLYDAGIHIPMAIRWGGIARPGRAVDAFINVRDLAPTFLEAAGVAVPGSMSGRSLLDILRDRAPATGAPARDRIVVGKERHDIGRPDDVGYPARGIRTPEYLYIRNYEPDRWPTGNPETGYRNCDDGPTKELILSRFDGFYRLGFGKRPAEELYDLRKDPDCVENRASDPALRSLKERLASDMEASLRQDEDPRMLGRGAIFDSYEYLGGKAHSYESWLKFRQ